MDKRKILTIVLSVLLVAVSVAAWFSVARAITVPEASTWLAPLVWFSLYAILACLAILLFVDTLLLELVLAATLFASIFFAPALWQLAAVALGGYFLFTAAHKIRRDMELSVKITPWKSLYTGKTYLLLSLAVIICMQYFVTIKKNDKQINAPELNVISIVSEYFLPGMKYIRPDLFDYAGDQDGHGDITVDEFLIAQIKNTGNNYDSQKSNEEWIDSQLPDDFPLAQKEAIKKQAIDDMNRSKNDFIQLNTDITIREAKKQLSDQFGIDIKGGEKMVDLPVLSAEAKLKDFYRSPMWINKVVPYIPIFFSIILLSIIYPVGSLFLSPVWFLLAKLIFFLLRKTEVISVKNISVQKEVLE